MDAVLAPIGKRVNSIVNYDSFHVDPAVSDAYLDLVRHVEISYYLKVSRYTTNGFIRIKLSRGLEERQISSDIDKNYSDATGKLDR